MSNVKLECIYSKYERFADEALCRLYVSASNLRTALLELLDYVGMYSDMESILEEEEHLGRQLTADEIISKLEDQNGDGCDMIYLLQDVNSKKVFLTYMVSDTEVEATEDK